MEEGSKESRGRNTKRNAVVKAAHTAKRVGCFGHEQQYIKIYFLLFKIFNVSRDFSGRINLCVFSG